MGTILSVKSDNRQMDGYHNLQATQIRACRIFMTSPVIISKVEKIHFEWVRSIAHRETQLERKDARFNK